MADIYRPSTFDSPSKIFQRPNMDVPLIDNNIRCKWNPSHVELYGNEMADKLAKNLSTPSTSDLVYLELYSLKKSQNLLQWMVPPTQHWYAGNRPGLSLALKCDTCSPTSLSSYQRSHQVPLILSEQKDLFHRYKVSR
ncbi:RNase H domain-containing protein [Trichonephila clavipes]|nr:RNase H domain-containing protein [Trichonephila clavipes]